MCNCKCMQHIGMNFVHVHVSRDFIVPSRKIIHRLIYFCEMDFKELSLIIVKTNYKICTATVIYI